MRVPRARLWAHALAVLLIAFRTAVLGQLSKPISTDAQVDVTQNKFLQRQASLDGAVTVAEDEVVNRGECDANIALKWMTEVSSSVYGTPLIHDLYSDGQKDVIVPSFVHYLEVLEGGDGSKWTDDGWPSFHSSMVHTSPILYDFDYDNVQDILIATYDGEILAIKDTGEQLAEKLVVPRLRVRKDWYQGLQADPIDHSHLDVGQAPDAQEAFDAAAIIRDLAMKHVAFNASVREDALGRENGTLTPPANSGLEGSRRRLLQIPDDVDNSATSTGDSQQRPINAQQLTEEGAESFHDLFGDTPLLFQGELGAAVEDIPDGALGTSLGDSEKPLDDADFPDLPEEGVAQMVGDGFTDDDVAAWHDRYEGMHYEDYAHHAAWAGDKPPDELWNDELYFAAPHERESSHVFVDAHLLTTPAIADIDGDGHDELVAAVSYFYDREYYDDPERRKELGKDVDISKYVASGVVVFSLRARSIKWSQHLDLSTDHTQYRAFAYSSPTLVDLDRDGRLEIILGTSMGFVYVLDSEGKTREGWPLQMGEVQAQVAVADVDNDGEIELVVGDNRGNVAAFRHNGKELWERHVKSLIAQAVTFGDINADGKLEVVFGTTSGHIYALDAATGLDIRNFPFETRGRILAPVLLDRVVRGRASMQAVVLSFDGHLYIVDGISGCADTFDIGETSYGMVLADDLDGDGRLDLLVATMNGNVYAFDTWQPYHPLKAWPSQVQAGNGFVARDNWAGIYATGSSRAWRDVRGQLLQVRFTILDRRPPLALAPGSPWNATRGPYTVFVTLQGVGQKEMNAGDQPVIGITYTYKEAGTYTMEVPCPRTRSTATVHLEMLDSHQLRWTDDFSLSFHVHFHKLLKWLVAVPVTLCAAAILAAPLQDISLSLPSYRRANGEVP